METKINELAATEFIQRIEEATRDVDKACQQAQKLQETVVKGRLKLAIFWVLAVYVAITLHDEHVRKCMVVQPNQEVHPACDVIFPFHDHQEIQDNLLIEVDRVQQEGRGINDGQD